MRASLDVRGQTKTRGPIFVVIVRNVLSQMIVNSRVDDRRSPTVICRLIDRGTTLSAVSTGCVQEQFQREYWVIGDFGCQPLAHDLDLPIVHRAGKVVCA